MKSVLKLLPAVGLAIVMAAPAHAQTEAAVQYAQQNCGSNWQGMAFSSYEQCYAYLVDYYDSNANGGGGGSGGGPSGSGGMGSPGFILPGVPHGDCGSRLCTSNPSG